MALEGLRGVAAVVVILFHIMMIFFPGLIDGVGAYSSPGLQNAAFEHSIYGSPLNALLSGTFSVSIFFVLSGFVLTIGFFQTKDANIIKRLAAKRYLRLMLPALAAVLLAYILLKLGANEYRIQAANATHSIWLSSLWNLIPHLSEAFSQGVYTVFSTGVTTYNPALWTLQWEMIGSFIVFGSALLFADIKHRWIIYLALLFIFSSTWLLGFIFGMALADVYSLNSKPLNRIPRQFIYVAAIVGVVLAGIPSHEMVGPIYTRLYLNFFSPSQNQSFYTAVGAILVVMAILQSPVLSRFFSHKKISILGKYTYSMYLVHMPILFSVCTSLFLALHTTIGFNKAIFISAFTTLVIIAVVAYFFEKFIDAPSIRLSGFFADVIFGKTPLISQSLLNKLQFWKEHKISADHTKADLK